MRKVWLVAVAVAALMLAGGVFAQEGKGKHGGKGAGSPGMKALESVMSELSDEQKAKVQEAKQKMMKAREEGGDVKAAAAEFEKALGGILTPEQMKKYTEARKAAMAERGGAEGKGEKKKRGGEQE